MSQILFIVFSFRLVLPQVESLYLLSSQHQKWFPTQSQCLINICSWKQVDMLTLFSFTYCCSCYLVAKLCLTLCDPMDCSTPGVPVLHHLLELSQTHVHQVGDAIQPTYPLSSPSLPAFNLSQHQGLFYWVSFLNQVAKVLEFQLQHQSLQWTRRTDLL